MEYYKGDKMTKKFKNSDNVKIKMMKVYPVPQHNLTKEDAKKVKDDWLQDSLPSKKGTNVLKELEFLTDAYPTIQISNLDMCSDMDEDVQLDMTFGFYIKKKKLFELMAALHTVDILWADECFPIRVNMSCEHHPNEFYWKKESGEVNNNDKKKKSSKATKKDAISQTDDKET